MDRRALVLGGGGVTGIAWETGLVAGLAGLGVDLAAADVIIGTSAGSVVGTDIACGQELEALYQARLAPPAPEPAARIGWDFIGRLLWDVHTSPDPKRARARIGRRALAVPTMPEADRRKAGQRMMSAGQRMMLAVLMGGNAGTGTSAVNPIGCLTPAGPHLVRLALGRTASRRRHNYTVVCGMRGAWR